MHYKINFDTHKPLTIILFLIILNSHNAIWPVVKKGQEFKTIHEMRFSYIDTDVVLSFSNSTS